MGADPHYTTFGANRKAAKALQKAGLNVSYDQSSRRQKGARYDIYGRVKTSDLNKSRYAKQVKGRKVTSFEAGNRSLRKKGYKGTAVKDLRRQGLFRGRQQHKARLKVGDRLRSRGR